MKMNAAAKKEQLMRDYFEPYLKNKGATDEEINRYIRTLTPPQEWKKAYVKSIYHTPALALRREHAMKTLQAYLLDKYDPTTKEGRQEMAQYKLPESFPFPYFDDDKEADAVNRFTTIRGGVRHISKLPPSLFF